MTEEKYDKHVLAHISPLWLSKGVANQNVSIDLTAACSLDRSSGKVQVGKDQEKAQSEKDSHSKNRGGKKPN